MNKIKPAAIFFPKGPIFGLNPTQYKQFEQIFNLNVQTLTEIHKILQILLARGYKSCMEFYSFKHHDMIINDII